MNKLKLFAITGLLSISTLVFAAENGGKIVLKTICYGAHLCQGYSFKTNEKFFSKTTINLHRATINDAWDKEKTIYKGDALVTPMTKNGIPSYVDHALGGSKELPSCGVMIDPRNNEEFKCITERQGIKWQHGNYPEIHVRLHLEEVQGVTYKTCKCEEEEKE